MDSSSTSASCVGSNPTGVIVLSVALRCLGFGSCRWPLRWGTATPVGFEPTRGDPIGLAGRRLNHSAKVSLARSTRNHGTHTHAPPHTTRAPPGQTTQTQNRTHRPRNQHAYCKYARRCHTPMGFANDKWPRGPMDKASAHGAGDCRFESCRGHLHNTPAAKPPATSTNKTTPRGFEPLRAEPNGFRVHLLNRSDTVS